jgi:hypothetical protein
MPDTVTHIACADGVVVCVLSTVVVMDYGTCNLLFDIYIDYTQMWLLITGKGISGDNFKHRSEPGLRVGDCEIDVIVKDDNGR